ncbi:TonB-dependent receptor plug domain-containing protein [Desulfurobacterium atlanticum]|uniref:Vitamin B12 transporter n=1 Tax=Desulfurobacterium atlanticum TaxID=240169 RepID=A0A238YCH3_9BACT|nr:TonB-dependent receptor [Desulfurobacterium atlanticum]SNR68293.1 vitamin B12 transporter [Desulfurobacterium atlanticum]
MRKLILATLSFVLPTAALATENATVEVTATRIPEKALTTESIIIDKDKIERNSIKTIADIFFEEPQITISNNGWGQISNVYIRGLGSKYILFLINGAPILNDPSTPEGTPDIDFLDFSSFTKIEVLKGVQGALYGSEAVGGVINFITEPENKTTLKIEGGSYDTLKETLKTGVRDKKSAFSMTFENFHSNGYDTTGDGDRESSSYHLINFNLKLIPKPSVKIKQFFSFKTGRNEYDNGEVNYQQILTTINSKILTSDRSILETVAGYGSTKRDYSYGTYTGETGYLSVFKKIFFKNITMSPGVDFKESKANSPSTGEKTINTKAIFLNTSFKTENLSLSPSIRAEKYSSFGTYTTAKLSGSFKVEKETFIKFQLGNGLKAPTIEQLYSYYPPMFGWPATYGNPDLEPEKSKGISAGLLKVFNKDNSVEVSYFYNKIDNQIVWTYDASLGYNTYKNLNNSKVEGIETSIKLSLTEKTQINTSYTYTNGRWSNGTNTYKIPKVPENMIKTNLNFKPSKNLSLNVENIYYSKRFDDQYNNRILPAFSIFNTSVSYKASEKITISGKILNITNKKYQLSYGYNQPGRSYFISIEAAF